MTRKIVGIGIVLCLVFLTSVGVSSVSAIDLPPLSELNGIDSAISALSGQKFVSNPKMDSGINRIVSDYKREKSGTIKAMSSSQTVKREKLITVETPEIVGGRVTVYLDLENKEDVNKLREEYDLTGVITTNFSETAQANVPVENLEDLANENMVIFISVPSATVLNAPDAADISSVMESKAVAEIQADQLHRMGITGEKVKAAIIDAGFYRYANNPEINNIEKVKSFRSDLEISPNNEQHGTIISEVYQDISYGDLSLYTVETSIEFVKAVEHIIAREDIRVLVNSFAFLGEGMPKQDSISSKAVDAARENNIIPVIAAGNFQQQCYQGKFTDTDGDGWHEFNKKGEKIDETQKLGFVEEGTHFNSYLGWLKANQDLDVYAIQETANLNIVGSSDGIQTGTQPAIEGILTVMNTGGFMHIAIYRKDSASYSDIKGNTELELFVTNVDLQYTSPDSVSSPAAAKGAIAVGAVEPGSREIQPYSSCGNISFIGISPVITWTTEPYYADGTSITAPQIAGAFALLMSAFPEATNEEILTAMQETALDLGPEGKDPIFGYGLPQVFDAYKYLCPPEIPENFSVNETVNSNETVMTP